MLRKLPALLFLFSFLAIGIWMHSLGNERNDLIKSCTVSKIGYTLDKLYTAPDGTQYEDDWTDAVGFDDVQYMYWAFAGIAYWIFLAMFVAIYLNRENRRAKLRKMTAFGLVAEAALSSRYAEGQPFSAENDGLVSEMGDWNEWLAECRFYANQPLWWIWYPGKELADATQLSIEKLPRADA